MRKLCIHLLAASLFSASVIAQAPSKMSYQAVIRNSSDALVTISPIGMRVSILQGAITGTAVYQEIFNPNPLTNANGLVTLEIGGGIALIGTFEDIDWSTGLYFIKIEADPTGGTNYTITGTSQLLSVPFALNAKTAETVTGGISETDPVFSGSQAANITTSDITNLSHLSGLNTGDQQLSVSATGDTLYLSNGNFVLLPGISKANQETVTDIDGNTYKTVKIGSHTWMAENLKTTKYADGTAIANGTSISNIGYTDKYYFIYQNDTNYKNNYGLLYSWAGATNGASSSTNPSGIQGVCPTGWHVPSNAEKTQLITFLGGSSVAGGKLKEIGTTHWLSPNTAATNESGFTALGTGGFYYQSAYRYNYMLLGQGAWFWTATTNPNHVDQSTAYSLNIGSNSGEAPIDNSENKGDGMSVRCVKD